MTKFKDGDRVRLPTIASSGLVVSTTLDKPTLYLVEHEEGAVDGADWFYEDELDAVEDQ